MYGKIHLELTNLLITDTNDSEEEMEEVFSWISEISREIPLHLSRYFPNYKFDKSQTPVATMKRGFKIAQKYLDFVYLGNINLDQGHDTVCPECGEVLIERNFYKAHSYLEEGQCPECGRQIYGKFN